MCFVDAVVSQVDELVVDMLGIICIFNCGKINNPILIDIDFERVNTGDQNIQADIKFESIDEEGIVNILLGMKIADKKKDKIISPVQLLFLVLRESPLKKKI